MPRWVKAFIAVGVVLVLLVAVIKLLGGDGHSPSRHLRGDGPPPSDVRSHAEP